MTVGELQKFLAQYPTNLEIVNRRFSDWQIISVDDWSMINGVARDFWIMNPHETMTEEDKQKSKEYLALGGN